MKLVINNEVSTDPIPETTLGPLVERLQKERESLGLYILLLRLDAEDLSLDYQQYFEKSLSEIESLEIEFAPIEALVARNLDNAGDYLDRLVPGLDKAAGLFRQGNEQEANQYFLNIIDGIEWFSEVVNSVIDASGQDIEKLTLNDETLDIRKERLLTYTKQMVEANQNKDWVLLADLLEYELVPYYQEWQTLLPRILPENPPN